MPISLELAFVLTLSLLSVEPRELQGQQIHQASFPVRTSETLGPRSFALVGGRHATPPADTAAHSHRRATIIGAVVGAAIGGLGGAAIGINQNAYECVEAVATCPRKPDRTPLYSFAGIVVGGALGAWIGHSLVTLFR